VAAAYKAYGSAFAERLNGDFALGLYDSKRQSLILVRDSIGIRPLYYCHTDEFLLFASEIKALLVHPRITASPNDDTLAKYLIGGSDRAEGATLFAGVHRVLPAHVVTAAPGGLVTRRYWDLDPNSQIRFRSFEEYTEEFRYRFERAVKRRLRSASPVAVPVSGGLDSSAIFCLAETLRRRTPDLFPSVHGFSYISTDGSPSDERAFLREIERAYELSIRQVPLEGDGFYDGAREGIWYAESPMHDPQSTLTDKFNALIRQSGAKLILPGAWGDQVLFDQSYLIDFFRRLAWFKIPAHLREYRQWMTDADPSHFTRVFLRSLIRRYVPDRIIPPLRKLRARVLKAPAHRWHTDALGVRARSHSNKAAAPANDHGSAHFQAIYSEVRSGSHVQLMEEANKSAAKHGLDIAFPFLDRDLLTFLAGIPGEIQTWNGRPKALLRDAMRGVLPQAIIDRRWKGDYTEQCNVGTSKDYPRAVNYLRQHDLAISRGYARLESKGKSTQDAMDNIRTSASCEAAWGFQQRFVLELWLQTFFGSNLQTIADFAAADRRETAAVSNGISY
jgi:asparagine synthase (glutamine-hydrolysing)